jgi:peptidoglycan biosynthesis protein MviN/MurJ (putative lipid II flippase)
MTRYPFYFRLILLACILSWATPLVFPQQPWHFILLSAAAGLCIWGMILMYLRKTEKSHWNGPNWGKRFQAWAGSKRVLAVFPAVCASMIPILFLLNRKLGLTHGQLGFTCGALLGISIVSLKFRKSGTAGCAPEEAPSTQQ